jgi:hypothetical protein
MTRFRRRALVLIAFAATACSHAPRPAEVGESLPGAPAPRRAVEQFLAAVKAQDLQAISTAWGTAKGPARDQMDRTELEKREIIMQGCFDHDKFRIIDESPGEDGKRLFRVELTRGTATATPRFTTVKGPSERWYVEDADIQAVRQLCRAG